MGRLHVHRSCASKALLRAGWQLDLATLVLALVALAAAAVVRRDGLDVPLFLAVNGWRALPDELWETLGVAGLGVTALAALSIGATRNPGVFAALPWMLVVAGGLTHLVKRVMPLPRPPSVLAAADVHVVGPSLFLRSMPSGHAMTAAAVIVLLVLAGGPAWRRPWVLATSVAVAAAIGVSRIASGVHWPSDVAAGAVLGVATGSVSVHLAQVTRTEAWFATAAGQAIVGATQIGAGVALAVDQGYGRTLPLQWVLATLVVGAGVRTFSEQPWVRLRRRRAAEART